VLLVKGAPHPPHSVGIDSGAGGDARVTPSYFAVLRLSFRGRDFLEADDRLGAEPVVIISDQPWTRVFDRRDAVLGSVITSTPVSLRVIGIAPPGF
jgi:hypothetical protein